jgi:hypothetical protein
MLIACIVCACSDNLDINQVYPFDLLAMPVPKKIAQGETVEIRCQLVREGEYKEAKYFIRYFQVDGKGELRLDNGTVFLPNDLYPLNNMTFRLYYTSQSTDQQTIDIYVEGSFGQVVQKTFSFQNETVEEE